MAYYPPGSPHWQEVERQQRRRSFRISKPAMIGIACLVFVALFLVFAQTFGVKIPQYQLGQVTEYARDGRTGLAYRVVLDPACSNDQLHVVFNNVTKNDGAPIHTVWFWSSTQLMMEGYGYDVAIISDDTGRAVLERK